MRRGGERARARARACAYFSSPPSLVWRQRRKAMMAQTQGFGRRYIKAFLKGFFVAVPVTVTFLDRVACIARVEGASMQPSLNPGGRQVSDVVLLNHWSIRNYEVQRGDIVSLVFSPNGCIAQVEGCLCKSGFLPLIACCLYFTGFHFMLDVSDYAK
ncbi:mitochondrial inner membrane protease subunit 2 isoform X9 [Rhineura floridana]|uniref:mitochondrial inner membrane protease subunit 2 isoform X9 n=1 Tax=Rhineura floridana TaxID=261503 RepID=UPI002AC8529E|nr:mitochondrial inner membrane protease subunit 2 isoform X9 [Rhineura floridana]